MADVATKVTFSRPQLQRSKSQYQPSDEDATDIPDVNEPLTERELAIMNELDENGWAHIHHAAFRGFVKSVERFVKASDEQLELETGDDLRSTPLLLAVMAGSLDTVQCLVELGASVSTTNAQNHGIVELCAFKEHLELLQYFIELDHERLPIWRNLVKFFASDIDEEVESAAKCLTNLTDPGEDGISPYWEEVVSSGAVTTVVRVVRGGVTDEAKEQALLLLLNLILAAKVQEQFTASGGLPALVTLIKSQNPKLVQLAALCLNKLCQKKITAEAAVKEGAIPALIKTLKGSHDLDILQEVAAALGTIISGNHAHQDIVAGIEGSITGLISLYEDCSHKGLLLALSDAVSHIMKGHQSNQNTFVNEGGAPHVIMLVRVKHRELQLSAVEAIRQLSKGNKYTSRYLLDEGVVVPLMQLLKRGRQPEVQEKTASAIWALAGDDEEEQRTMADMMGVQQLIEFLSSQSDELHLIGSQGLGVLACGPLNKQTEISQANGVHPLVRLLRSNQEHIVLHVIRTLRYLCVSVGYQTHLQNQQMVASSRGTKFLIAMMAHCKNELIQVEAAYTLAAVALGNNDNLEEIKQNADFSYVRILKMLYSNQEAVRLVAGSALATFAYNSLAQQKDIAEQGGVRFSCFLPFLQSDDEYNRVNAAFQVVVLARIIPDEEQAVSSAAGIKLLTDLLADSSSNTILALTTDCIARLAHTRAGVPAAFVSIAAVNLLCDLLESKSEQVRGSSAIALGYLSYNHQASRQLLNRCRQDPVLMKVLLYFTKNRLSPDLMEGWRHCKQVGLPPIDEGRVSLIARKTVHYKNIATRPMTMTSLDDTGVSTNLPTRPPSPVQANESQVEPSSQIELQSPRTTPSAVPQATPRGTPHSQGRTSVGSHQTSTLPQELPQGLTVE